VSDLRLGIDSQKQEFVVTCSKCGAAEHLDLQVGLEGPIYCPCGEQAFIGEDIEVSRMRDQ
jgi:hypothetical protein